MIYRVRLEGLNLSTKQGAQDLEQISGILATAQGLYTTTLFCPERSLGSTQFSDKRAAFWTSEVSKQADWQKDPTEGVPALGGAGLAVPPTTV